MGNDTDVSLDDLDLIDDDEQALPPDDADESEAEAGMSTTGPPSDGNEEVEFENDREA